MSLSKNYPDLALEWHGELNTKTFDDYTVGSNKIVWWFCKSNQKHKWPAAIAARTIKGTGCPFCSGQKVDQTNNLNIINPELAREWHPKKNKGLSPDNIFHRSTKKVWWKCEKGPDHEWKASPRQRSNAKIRCLFCDGKKLSITNCLAVVSPDLAAEWHPTKNGTLTPFDVTFKSTKIIWWKCSVAVDHEWKETVAYRRNHPNCIFCSGKRVSTSNSLSEKFPHIADEWHYEFNAPLTPDQVTYGSGKNVYWKCGFDPSHNWKARINSRTSPSQLNGCQICGARQKSSPELRILAELKTVFPEIKYRERIDGKEIDFFIPSLNLGIEYDGAYYHKNKLTVDIDKNKFFLKKNIKIVRLRRTPLEKISIDDVIVNFDQLQKLDIDTLLMGLLSVCSDRQKTSVQKYLLKEAFQNEKFFNILLAEFPKPAFENSLEALHPELVKEWDYELNDPLTPSQFTPGSDKIVYWRCILNDKHNWPASISHRTDQKNPSRCPHCFGKGPHKRVTTINSFMTCFPEAAKEFHPTKNGNLTLDKISFGSGISAYWLCLNCGDTWQSAIRKHKKPGCSQRCRNILKKK